MARIPKRIALLAAGLAVLSAGVVPTDGAAAAVPCPLPSGCSGLKHVVGPHGEDLGFTHGPDPIPLGNLEPLAEPTDPICVTPTPGDYYIVPIYARAFNDTDRYAATADAFRDLIRQANAVVDAAASVVGDRARLRVLCDGSTITVQNETLPTAMTSADFSTITSDLRARGYTDTHVKYVVFYDDTGACACGGQGNVYSDDRAGVNNPNNGNASAPMFAIDYGYVNTRTVLHELGHTLGAVQNSAPNTTGAHHCIDGGDIMCYNDGGPRGALYTDSVCGGQPFDCNQDDYFNLAPPPGSYLANHWDIGSTENRFLGVFQPPVLQSLNCPSYTDVGAGFSCSFQASDPDSSSIGYSIDWGDGTAPTVMEHAPGSMASADHTYAIADLYTITVIVSDPDGLSATPLTSAIEAGHDHTPPSVTLVDPQQGLLYRGCSQTTAFLVTTFLDTGCVSAIVSDDVGLADVSVYIDDALIASSNQGPFVYEFPVGKTGQVSIKVIATDLSGNTTQVDAYVYAISIDV